MKTLIVGRYEQLAEAENASRDLLRAGFLAREMSLFCLNPQAQHALHPVGGDEDESAGTHEARSGAVRGAVGGVGAGTLGSLRDFYPEPDRRHENTWLRAQKT